MKRALLIAILLIQFGNGYCQSSKAEIIADSIISAYEYSHDKRQIKGLVDMELGRIDIGLYKSNNKNIHLYQFRGSSDTAGESHYLIVLNSAKNYKIFDGRDLKTDLLELFKYLHNTVGQMNPVEKNRLIMDFVKNW